MCDPDVWEIIYPDDCSCLSPLSKKAMIMPSNNLKKLGRQADMPLKQESCHSERLSTL